MKEKGGGGRITADCKEVFGPSIVFLTLQKVLRDANLKLTTWAGFKALLLDTTGTNLVQLSNVCQLSVMLTSLSNMCSCEL